MLGDGPLKGAATRFVAGATPTQLDGTHTVLADAASWQHDPWSGHIDDDGVLWGRGAIDMKSQTAAEVAAALALAADGWRPASGLLRIVVAVDEEVGGTLGARWLCWLRSPTAWTRPMRWGSCTETSSRATS